LQLDNARKGFQEASKRFDDTTKGYEEAREKGLKFINDESNTLEQRKQTLDFFYANKLITEKDFTDASIKIAQLEKDAKLNLLAAYGQTLGQISDLVGKETAAGKAFAIAATTIDTYVAAFRAYKEGLKLDPTGTFSIIAAAAAAATGLKAVRNIIAVKVPGGSGGGGGSMPNMSSSPASPPILRPTSSNVNIGNTTPIKTSNQNEGGKVYVLESDITNSQNNVDSIKKKATIK
jgi:hypothetical protein